MSKITNHELLKLLFVTPNYGGTYKYFNVELDYFDKSKYECHIMYISDDDIDNVIQTFKLHNFDCVVNLCDGKKKIDNF